ncbi:MAG: hypothetical protein P4L46_00630 [Fimbriimonas sp.]|nr:hypothetical protein [Fimbriimonas sp.]
MSPTLSSSENAVQLLYLGNDCLYRDHRGHRVILDIEGLGEITCLTSDCRLLVTRGDAASSESEGPFDNGCTVVALEAGLVSVNAVIGRSTPISGDIILTTDGFDGSGWVISASDAFWVDDRKEAAPRPSPGFAVPFFRRVEGGGDLSIIPNCEFDCVLADTLRIDDEEGLSRHWFSAQNMSAVFTLESSFANGASRTGYIASHLNAASFRTTIPDRNAGLILRKMYDRFHGRQRARVFVEGEFAGWWYEPSENRACRWHTSDFGVERRLTEGRSEVTITIEPPAGVPLWSVSEYQIFALALRNR